MSTERDIIIERLEQKLAARDKEFAQMQESLRESLIIEMEKRFGEKLKLRESTVDEIRMKFSEKINEIVEMNKSLRDSLLEQKKSEPDSIREMENRLSRMERRLMELNSNYDGVMKELLDQKSIIHEIGYKKPTPPPKAETKASPPAEKAPERPKPKGEYIIADNYIPKDKRKPVAIIEADEIKVNDDAKPPEVKEQPKKPEVRKSQRVSEGVEIVETLKKR
jgi:hypothetical protein